MPIGLFDDLLIGNRRLYSNQYTIVPNNNTGLRTKVGQMQPHQNSCCNGEIAKAAMPSVAHATVHDINSQMFSGIN